MKTDQCVACVLLYLSVQKQQQHNDDDSQKINPYPVGLLSQIIVGGPGGLFFIGIMVCTVHHAEILITDALRYVSLQKGNSI